VKGHRSNLIVILLVSLIACSTLIGFLLSRFSDTVLPQEADLARYQELQIFLAGRTTFRGLFHDLDTNFYSFAFKTSLGLPKQFFDKVVVAAKHAGWRLQDCLEKSCSFRKKSDAYPAATHDDLVTLTLDSETNEIIFLMRPDYS